MSSDDIDLLKASKKENLLYSKELSDLIDPVYNKRPLEDLYFEAVFNKNKIILEYIKAKFKKNRVKLRCICNVSYIDIIINSLPESISLYFKNKEIKKINLQDSDDISLSIKKKGHSYIVDYIIDTQNDRLWR
jgi:hypothetical protein